MKKIEKMPLVVSKTVPVDSNESFISVYRVLKIRMLHLTVNCVQPHKMPFSQFQPEILINININI